MGKTQSRDNESFHIFDKYVDEYFLKLEILQVEVAIRKIKGMFNHSDIIFYCECKDYQSEILIVSFHDYDIFNERVTYYRQSREYIENKKDLKQYKEIKQIWEKTNQMFQITDAILICQIISQLSYNLIDNNCNDSAKQLELILSILEKMMSKY